MIDLENPPVYTTVDEFDAELRDPQTLFDYVMAQLIKQSGPSLAEGPMAGCRYRGANGRKCAAGHILPDSIFEKRPSVNSLSLLHLVGHQDAKDRAAFRRQIADQVGQGVVGDNPPAIFIDKLAWTYLRQNILLVIRLQEIHDLASVHTGNGHGPINVWHQALLNELTERQHLLNVDIGRVYTYLKKLSGIGLSDTLAP